MHMYIRREVRKGYCIPLILLNLYGEWLRQGSTCEDIGYRTLYSGGRRTNIIKYNLVVLSKAEEVGRKYGIKINNSQMKVTRILTTDQLQKVPMTGDWREVEHFKYLFNMIRRDEYYTKDISAAIANALPTRFGSYD